LHGGEYHAEERCGETERQRHHAPPPHLSVEEVERDAQ
jgi:hypothetical protein